MTKQKLFTPEEWKLLDAGKCPTCEKQYATFKEAWNCNNRHYVEKGQCPVCKKQYASSKEATNCEMNHYENLIHAIMSFDKDEEGGLN